MGPMPLLRRPVALVVACVAAATSAVVAAGPSVATNDPLWSRQWAPLKIGAPSAWEATTGAGIKVGIVDSGVDLGHQDLQGRVAANAACIGTNGAAAGCVAGGGQDVNGHGTHVSGIVAANKDNGVGTSGIAPSVQLVMARVFQGDAADLGDVEAGIRWAVDQGAKVVNVSLGENVLLGGLLGGGGSLVPVLNEAWARGAIPVVASGNAQLLSGSPGYGNVNAIIVGATGPDDELAGYSVSTGSAKWALVAPGGNGADARQIISTYWQPGATNQYGVLQGTSMATPHVSASLALLLSRGVSQQRAVELLLATANKAVSCGSTCAGRLDVGAAMAATGFTPPTTQPPAPSTTAATAAPTTAARPRPTAARRTVPSTAATTLAPVPDTTVAPEPVPETSVPETEPQPLQAAAAAEENEDEDLTVPGSVAGVLLLGVGAASALIRRRRA